MRSSRTSSPTNSAEPMDQWRLPRQLRHLVAIFVGLVIVVEVSLVHSWLSVRATGEVAQQNADLIGSFGDVQRSLNSVVLAAVTADGIDDTSLQAELDILGRQISLGHRRIDDPHTKPWMASFIEELEFAYAQLRDSTSLEQVVAVASAYEVRAKQNHDRVQQENRTGMIQQVGDTDAAGRATAAVGILVLALGALFLTSLARRYRMVYADAYELAISKAAELATANDSLRAADALRDHFVSVTSHELRSPLSVIHGSAETLRLRGALLDDGQQAALLDGITRAADRQGRIIDDLLEVARRGHGALEATPGPVDVPALLQDVVGRMDVVEGARVQLGCGGPCVAMVDRSHLEQVLENLVNNARKYGGPSVRVTADADPTGPQVLVVVEDDGPGVPPEFRARLFDPFSQAAESPTSGGVGLGLSIVHDLVTANGGSVTYTDRHGGGARFEVRLPAPA